MYPTSKMAVHPPGDAVDTPVKCKLKTMIANHPCICCMIFMVLVGIYTLSIQVAVVLIPQYALIYVSGSLCLVCIVVSCSCRACLDTPVLPTIKPPSPPLITLSLEDAMERGESS